MINLPPDDCFRPDPSKPMRLLTECPAYCPSPLIGITEPSNSNGQIILKDETNRMGLGSFKALGGVYAVAKLITEAWEAKHNTALAPDQLLSESVRGVARNMTFVCASAGNHGIAVAAGARLFSAKARVHLSETVPNTFEKRLRGIGAAVKRSGKTYEESMTAAIDDAASGSTVLLADSSWPEYIKVPSLVMEGYTVIAEELRRDFEKAGNWPTHVFLQAGVGGLAASLACMIRENWAVQPKIIIIEPDRAPCIKESVEAQRLVKVSGPASNMGRLDCKEPSIVALDVLNRTADNFILVSDQEAMKAVKVAEKLGIFTTPSGAAGMAGLLSCAKSNLGIDEHSRSLVILSEGNAR